MLANQLLPLGQRLVNLWLVTLNLSLQLDVLLVEGLSLVQVLAQHLKKTRHFITSSSINVNITSYNKTSKDYFQVSMLNQQNPKIMKYFEENDQI